MKKILSLGILSETQSHQVGGKSQNLDTLLKAGFPVLEGFCIPQSEYEYFLAFHTLSPELQGDLKELEIWYKDTPLALRSSASVEDSQTESYAGHFETFLGIGACDLERYILQSYTHFHEKLLSFPTMKDAEKSPFLGLLIQRLLESDISGVAFSQHPLTGKQEVYIEAVAGYGEALVSGEISPEIYDSQSQIGAGNTLLSEIQYSYIVSHITQVKNILRFPVDMEWSFEGDAFYILQARPITVVSKKEIHIPQEIFEHHISLTEWLEKIGHSDTEKLREEDNLKRKRMGELTEYIDFPYDAPASFEAQEIVPGNFSQKFSEFFEKNKEKPCALRLIPKEKDLPKLRMRGMSIEEVTLSWFPKQDIKPENYTADFVPHPETIYWSSIFVVSPKGIQGEFISGGHHLLTQGLDTSDTKRIYFFGDFTTLTLSEENPTLREHLENILSYIHISAEKRSKVEEKFSVECSHGFLPGYFETVLSKEFGLHFIDWNRNLGTQELSLSPKTSEHKTSLQGKIASRGSQLHFGGILQEINENTAYTKDDILFCSILSPKYIPLLQQAGAIISEQGGILSHAAIICRDLKIPYIVGVSKSSLSQHFGKKMILDMQTGEIIV